MPDKYPIGLGKTMSSPSVAGLSPSKDEPYYPSIHLEWDEPYDLPDSGTMTVKFSKSHESTSKRKGEKQGHQSVTLDITSIESVEPAEGEGTDEEAPGDVLDRLKGEVEAGEE